MIRCLIEGNWNLPEYANAASASTVKMGRCNVSTTLVEDAAFHTGIVNEALCCWRGDKVIPQAVVDKTETERRSISRADMRLTTEHIHLVHDHVAVSDGVGDAVDVGSQRGKLIVLTLEIDSVLEDEALNASIWGSPDGVT